MRSSPTPLLFNTSTSSASSASSRHALLASSSRPLSSELAVGRTFSFDVPDLASHSWIETCPAVAPRILPLARDLGPGESEVLAYSLANPGVTALLDDKLGRRVAESLRVPSWERSDSCSEADGAASSNHLGLRFVRLGEVGFRLEARTSETVLRLAGELK